MWFKILHAQQSDELTDLVGRFSPDQNLQVMLVVTAGEGYGLPSSGCYHRRLPLTILRRRLWIEPFELKLTWRSSGCNGTSKAPDFAIKHGANLQFVRQRCDQGSGSISLERI